jgi:tricorn protease
VRSGAAPSGYFRTPTVHGDLVVFRAEDDLWSVDLAGGPARRLTAGLGECARPVLSPDGTLLAFTSREEHHPEVWCMPAEGGRAHRVTFLGANSLAVAWTNDGEIVFRGDHGQPFVGRHSVLFAVTPQPGEPKQLPYGWANDVAYGAQGGVVLGRHTLDPAIWKRYRGGRAGQLWVDARGTGAFKRLPLPDGNVTSPMWIGARIWFVSDHEGIGNVYSCTPAGKDLRRHTDHDVYYARAASTDGRTIVYQHAAELWALDVASDRAARIEVGFASPRAHRNRRFVDAAEFMHSFDVHPDGHSLAVDSRGRAFTLPLWDGPVRALANDGAARQRLPVWLADGERVAAIVDDGEEEALEIVAPPAKRKRFAKLDLGRAMSVVANPKRNTVAIANHRLELIVVDLDAGRATVLDTNRFEHFQDLAWSPDGAWLAYVSAETFLTRSIKLCQVSTGRTALVTRPEFKDRSPSWDPGGAYLAFASYRTFDPVPDAFYFWHSFPRGSKPYLVTLQAAAPNPFLQEPAGFGAQPDDAKKPEKDAAIKIDLDGIDRRVLAFPVPEGRDVSVRAIGGKVLFLRAPVSGSLGADGDFESDLRASLESYDFKEQKHETLVSGVSEFRVARDDATLVYRAGRRLRALKAGERPDEKTEKDAPSRKSGWIDTGRIRVSVDPGAEWRQMFREAWRLQRENFWTADMSGVDWELVYERYRPLVEKVSARGEFADLIWEMHGELGTSHAYEIGGDYRKPPAYATGHLGADFALDRAGRYVIDHIVRGDPWSERETSPLSVAGVPVAEGDTILAVNGVAVGRDRPLRAELVHQAGQWIELTVGDKAGRRPRAVRVKAMRDEQPARYREWVERNREMVHAATNGRAGYVHVVNMGPLGYSEFHRYFLSESERDALVVDVRFNGGGNVSQILLDRLARVRTSYHVPRWGEPMPTPHESMLGPMVCVTNESAGSDGDSFTHVFKQRKLGTVVGKRTWGGVIGIWPKHVLADKGYTTQPEYASFYVDKGWEIENRGVEPDVEVDYTPQDYAAGRDPQLAEAIKIVLAQLKKAPPKLPDFSKRPKLRLPKLPKR